MGEEIQKIKNKIKNRCSSRELLETHGGPGSRQWQEEPGALPQEPAHWARATGPETKAAVTVMHLHSQSGPGGHILPPSKGDESGPLPVSALVTWIF